MILSYFSLPERESGLMMEGKQSPKQKNEDDRYVTHDRRVTASRHFLQLIHYYSFFIIMTILSILLSLERQELNMIVLSMDGKV